MRSLGRRGALPWFLAFGLVLAPPGWGQDVLRRCDDIADHVVSTALRGIESGPAPGPGESRWWILPVAARVALAANEAVWFLEPDHHISLQVGSWISREPHGLDGADQIAERVRSEARGVGSYRAMRIDYGSLVRRDVAWKHRQVGGDRWIVRFERERALSDLPAEPWSGKWIGAYSMPDDISGEARAAPAGGPLSALVLEDGSRCAIHLVSAVWQFTAVGNIRSHHLAASFPPRTPYASHVISAQLDPEKRELRGGLQFSSAPGRVRKGAFYLRHLETDR